MGYQWQLKKTINVAFTITVYGIWATWASWGSCDVTCGGGIQTRIRTCTKVDEKNIDCVGNTSMTQACNQWNCPGSINAFGFQILFKLQRGNTFRFLFTIMLLDII